MSKTRLFLLALVACALTLVAAGCLHTDDGGGDGGTAAQGDTGEGGEAQGGEGAGLLAEVQERGTLNCGVNEAVPGFGIVTEDGGYEGFDIDFCRVVAAAVLGDAEAVEFMPLTAEQRFTALQSGEIDVLIRNTTWTSSRDGAEGARFLHTTYYDGQGMMVNADSEFQTLADLDGANICVLSGTTTELNLETVFSAQGLDYTPVAFEENDPLQQAFLQGRCDAWTSDISQLAGIRSAWPENEGGPDALRILEEIMSKEPLGPAVRDGDDEWADAVNWAVISTVLAEEHEVSSENIDEATGSDDPDVQRLLGQPVEGEPFDPGLGLDPDFAVNVIRDVGNYGEIFERNLAPIGLERDLNELWTNGGLQYGPPYR